MRATLTGPVKGGDRGWPFGTPDPADIEAHGYVMEEFFFNGTARRYRAKPGTDPDISGEWEAEPSEEAPYATRLYVVRPADPAQFNGVLLANWQNVTAGVDLGTPMGEIFNGYAWAGITAQKIGIDGIAGRTLGLTRWDPERYGSLHHPGDAFSYDIFAQAARALKEGGSGGDADPLNGLRPSIVIAHGASQSAMRLGSYINIAHPFDRLFDGFFLTAHWGLCPPLEDNSLMEQFAVTPGGLRAAASRIHDRGDTPILVVASQTEAPDNYPVRQPDTDSFRFWEVAGGTHAPLSTSAAMRKVAQRDGAFALSAPVENPNIVVYDYILDAGLRWMVRWITDGTPPPRFPPIEIGADSHGNLQFQRDANGNVRGGIRLPELEAATGVHQGTNEEDPFRQLRGRSLLFDPARMIALHGSRDDFLRAWDEAVTRLEDKELASQVAADAIRRRGRAVWPDR